MAFAVPLLVTAAVATGAKLLTKALMPKPKAQSVAVPQQAQIRTNSQVADTLLSRRGTRDNNRTGPRGAEAGGGMKTKLGQ